MKTIGLLSDTHSFIDEAVYRNFERCDEIWHAGDIGDIAVWDELNAFKPTRAVYGNIDDTVIRSTCPKDLHFMCEEVKVYMTHIGGYPGRYNARVRNVIETHAPQLYICGHSHILKVIYDKQYDLLHMNPGAIGNHGFHKVKTMLRFTIDGKRIDNLEIIEVPRR